MRLLASFPCVRSFVNKTKPQNSDWMSVANAFCLYKLTAFCLYKLTDFTTKKPAYLSVCVMKSLICMNKGNKCTAINPFSESKLIIQDKI